MRNSGPMHAAKSRKSIWAHVARTNRRQIPAAAIIKSLDEENFNKMKGKKNNKGEISCARPFTKQMLHIIHVEGTRLAKRST